MDVHDIAAAAWAGLEPSAPPAGSPSPAAPAATATERLTVTGPAHTLPSVFRATAAATAAVGVATLAVDEVRCRRLGTDPGAITVDTRHAACAAASERLLTIDGAPAGDVWDPLAGVYRAADGWVRLHTNFRAHRAAALAALALPSDTDDRAAVAAAVAARPAQAVEDATIAAGGCAAALRTVAAWRASDQGRALAAEPLVRTVALGAPPPGTSRDLGTSHHPSDDDPPAAPSPARPLAGVRVLDLTRVIAGPVAGRFLGGHGAEVLRVDGPAAEDSPVLVADTTVGKRTAVVDLATVAGAAQMRRLVAGADVVLCAYRPGALAGHGWSPAALATVRPGLVVGTLSAYGGTGVGPWGARRGFDSLVQMVTGIADEGRRAAGAGDDGAPVPLPVQLLDHASGYLLAAGVLRALAARGDGGGREVRVSLARTAVWLDGLGREHPQQAEPVPAELPDDLAVSFDGPLGRTRHVACPGRIDGLAPSWTSGPVPLGHDAPAWGGPS